MRSFFVTVIILSILNTATMPALAATTGPAPANPGSSPNAAIPVSGVGTPVSATSVQQKDKAPHLLACSINRQNRLLLWSSLAPASIKSIFSTLNQSFSKVEMYRFKYSILNCGSAPWEVKDPEGVCQRLCWDECIKKGADGLTTEQLVKQPNALTSPWKGAVCQINYGKKDLTTGKYMSCHIGYSMASLPKGPSEKLIFWDKSGHQTLDPLKGYFP